MLHAGPMNPFRPGDAPLVLAGREQIRAEIEDMVRLAGLSWRPTFLEGPRGVGKTSLVDWADEPITNRGLLHIKLEARRGASLFDLLDRWSSANQTTMAELGLVAAPPAATDIEVHAGPVKVRRAKQRAAAEPARTDIEFVVALLDALAGPEAGVVVSVDEAQVGGARLVQDISSLLTAARNSRWTLNFLIAGLPSMRKLIAPNRRNAGSLGQLERGSWLTVAPRLQRAETAYVIVESMQLTGDGWRLTAGAVDRVFDLTAGYPYAVQLLGSELWETVGVPRAIGAADIDRVRDRFADKLGSSLFASRWRQMPGQERRYVRALVELVADDEDITNAKLAAHLGKRPSETTYLRERLLDAGVIVVGSTPRSTEFITPLFADYIREQIDDSDET